VLVVVGEIVAVLDAVGLFVTVAVDVIVAVEVIVGVFVAVPIGVNVIVGVRVGVSVAVLVGVRVKVWVTVAVCVGVIVGVRVGVSVDVWVRVIVAVIVGVFVGPDKTSTLPGSPIVSRSLPPASALTGAGFPSGYTAGVAPGRMSTGQLKMTPSGITVGLDVLSNVSRTRLQV